jgi:hypothetical protein
MGLLNLLLLETVFTKRLQGVRLGGCDECLKGMRLESCETYFTNVLSLTAGLCTCTCT